ncbi:unnamed protein product [Miscanthus lutarioriparius]|uniref:RING-type domain-containing protein n=1 Tax=Miscanthus lutarioriparius TaxID=422564 RepID=A0A811QC43_9POAL|nr:unnamed protein product [Miscanthus lutarioriparius]
MAVQAQFVFSGLAGCLLPYGSGGLAEEQIQALMSPAAGNKPHRYKYNRAAGVASAAQSDLTCNGGAGVVPPSRKRGRDAEHEQYVPSSSSTAALLPIPGTHMHQAIAGHQLPPALGAATTADRLAESATTSTSGRPASGAGALVSELLRQHGAEIDALVRAECDRLRAGLEQAQKRQCLALARAAEAAAVPALREVEAELAAARRRAGDLEELLRQAATESQAWCGLARSNGAVAAGLRAAIDAVLLQGAGAGGTGTGTARPAAEEGFGDSGGTDDDAQSCCCAEAVDATAATASASSSWNDRWACKACGEGEVSVLLLPCRHVCLCKACEPRTDACPVCLGAKNASIHIAPN